MVFMYEVRCAGGKRRHKKLINDKLWIMADIKNLYVLLYDSHNQLDFYVEMMPLMPITLIVEAGFV